MFGGRTPGTRPATGSGGLGGGDPSNLRTLKCSEGDPTEPSPAGRANRADREHDCRTGGAHKRDRVERGVGGEGMAQGVAAGGGRGFDCPVVHEIRLESSPMPGMSRSAFPA